MRVKTRRKLGFALMVFVALTMVWGVNQSLPFVIVTPGPAFNVLGEDNGTPIIDVTGVPVDDSPGKLDMLTISEIGSPGYYPTLLELTKAYFSGDKVIYPAEAFYPVGSVSAELRKQELADFEASKAAALTAAKENLSPEIVQKMNVSIKLQDVGGPSGGLMFTLGIIDKASKGSLTGGKNIAGTGTMAANGVVGAIGGIRQKLIAASRAGDKFFFAPKDNCAELLNHVPSGLRVIPVSKVSEALKYLDVIAHDGAVSKLPVCSAK